MFSQGEVRMASDLDYNSLITIETNSKGVMQMRTMNNESYQKIKLLVASFITNYVNSVLVFTANDSKCQTSLYLVHHLYWKMILKRFNYTINIAVNYFNFHISPFSPQSVHQCSQRSDLHSTFKNIIFKMSIVCHPFQSRKRLYNHQCPFVRLSVSHQNPPTA